MKIMDIQHLNTAGTFQWTHDYLFKYLTGGSRPIITNPNVIAAFRRVDRQDFLPAKLKARAYEDIELDIGYGETLTRPSVLAKMAELMKPVPGGKYLDIGTGTGYLAIILGFIAGEKGKVFTVERLQWLWEQARSNSTRYSNINNVSFLYRDGMKGLQQQAPFDAIQMSFAMDIIPEEIKMQLKGEGGRLVVPSVNSDLRVIERQGDMFTEEIVPDFLFERGKEGVG